MREARIGLLTGPVSVGKTTVAERVVGLARRRGFTCGGLLAPAMMNLCGQKVGVWGVDVDSGERRILACTDRDLGGPSVGPYSFEAGALDWAVGIVDRALRPSDLFVVDEIGKLELWCGTGLASVLPRLAAGEARRSLVVVRDSLLAELQARLGPVEQKVFRIDVENRQGMAQCILEDLLGVPERRELTRSG